MDQLSERLAALPLPYVLNQYNATCNMVCAQYLLHWPSDSHLKSFHGKFILIDRPSIFSDSLPIMIVRKQQGQLTDQ